MTERDFSRKLRLGLGGALKLLRNNYHKTDDSIIHKLIKKSLGTLS